VLAVCPNTELVVDPKALWPPKTDCDCWPAKGDGAVEAVEAAPPKRPPLLVAAPPKSEDDGCGALLVPPPPKSEEPEA
jgi:hypothetical protein